MKCEICIELWKPESWNNFISLLYSTKKIVTDMIHRKLNKSLYLFEIFVGKVMFVNSLKTNHKNVSSVTVHSLSYYAECLPLFRAVYFYNYHHCPLTAMFTSIHHCHTLDTDHCHAYNTSMSFAFYITEPTSACNQIFSTLRAITGKEFHKRKESLYH